MKKPLVIFVSLVIALTLIFFLFPINLFDGEIVKTKALQEYTIKTNLSLSYFIGLGYDKSDMTDVTTFYLTTKGLIMAFIFILGFPALLAYRIYLKNTKPN